MTDESHYEKESLVLQEILAYVLLVHGHTITVTREQLDLMPNVALNIDTDVENNQITIGVEVL